LWIHLCFSTLYFRIERKLIDKSPKRQIIIILPEKISIIYWLDGSNKLRIPPKTWSRYGKNFYLFKICNNKNFSLLVPPDVQHYKPTDAHIIRPRPFRPPFSKFLRNRKYAWYESIVLRSKWQVFFFWTANILKNSKYSKRRHEKHEMLSRSAIIYQSEIILKSWRRRVWLQSAE
jgi:hypothetical protein